MATWRRTRHSRLAAVVDRAGTERRLLRMAEDAFRRARERGGGHIACDAGCADCCSGPFPVPRLDARRLRRGLAELDRVAPERAAAVRRRAAEARRELREGGCDAPGADPAAESRFAALPCPALEPGSGTCELYEHRPLACRTYGPPLLFGRRRAPHCPLCFRGAPAEEIERCRVEPDPGGLEDRLRRGEPEGDEETFIAFVL